MKSQLFGLKILFCIMLVIAGVWMIILPLVSDLPTVRKRIENNRTAGINPTAVFYTDHPGMVDIERNIQARVDSSPESFWTFNF